jgi:hypothetical protein
MHLRIAEQIMGEAERGNCRLHALLQQEWPAFYFGSVAPDYQSICGIPREQTHFYGIPPEPDNQGYNVMLRQFPELAHSQQLPPTQAMFVAAYSVHLMYDLIWLRDIVDPYFFHAKDMGDRQQRILVHFILLTYLDKLAFESLPETAVSTLAAAQAEQWLPFARNEHLLSWRDEIVPQLQPGACIRTIEIYAERLGMTPDEFAINIEDPDWMDRHIFGQLPVPEIQNILDTAVPRSLNLIADYLLETRDERLV